MSDEVDNGDEGRGVVAGFEWEELLGREMIIVVGWKQ